MHRESCGDGGRAAKAVAAVVASLGVIVASRWVSRADETPDPGARKAQSARARASARSSPAVRQTTRQTSNRVNAPCLVGGRSDQLARVRVWGPANAADTPHRRSVERTRDDEGALEVEQQQPVARPQRREPAERVKAEACCVRLLAEVDLHFLQA